LEKPLNPLPNWVEADLLGRGEKKTLPKHAKIRKEEEKDKIYIYRYIYIKKLGRKENKLKEN
jgi:hypothetical protein